MLYFLIGIQARKESAIPFYVTFHGGSPTTSIPKPHQHVVSYTPDSKGGWTVNPNVFHLPKLPSHVYNELRDIQFCADGNFYVANGYKNSSVIWKIPPSGAPSGGPTIFTQGAVPPCQPVSTGPAPVVSIYHPFGFAFDALMGVCYISNQDDNVVVAVHGPYAPGAFVPGEPLPVNPWLVAHFSQPPNFLAGTFVPSQTGFLPPCQSGDVPPSVSSAQGGLAYSPSGGPPLSNSVRGVALLGTGLFVADEVGNMVRVYDTTGATAPSAINDPAGLIQGPTHLLLHGAMLYITVAGGSGSTDPSVLSYDTSQGSGTSNTSLRAIVFAVKDPSGMTFDAANSPNFYLASRSGQSISQYDSNFRLLNANFIPRSQMTDQPEFILFGP
jgi:hypothetical protein